MKNVYEKRNNYDLRKLVAGSERWVDHLLRSEKQMRVTNSSFVSLTHSVRILPIESSIREKITSAIQSNCSKIKNLVFAVLLANSKLITLVRMKNYCMHTDDLRLIFNVIECSESFKTAENWLPICLPKFDPVRFCKFLKIYPHSKFKIMFIFRMEHFTLTSHIFRMTAKHVCYS